MNLAMLGVAVLAAMFLPLQDGGGHDTAGRPAGIWAGVDIGERPMRIPEATLSDSQQKAVLGVIHAHAKLDGLERCDVDEPNGEWLGKVQFQSLPVTATKQVILAQSGVGCARGGQGANGAMWVVELGGGKPVLLASPKDGFDGWLYAVQPAQSHGYKDVVFRERRCWRPASSDCRISTWLLPRLARRRIPCRSLVSLGDRKSVV